MRLKIIAVFTVVVLIVGGLSYALTRATVSHDEPQDAGAQRALVAALAQLKVEGLTLERWLGTQAVDPKVREPFSAGTEDARGEAATAQANRIAAAAAAAPELGGLEPTVVMLVDAKGVVLGRDKSKLMRKDRPGDAYPRLVEALEKGVAGSDVWVNKDRNEQMLASYVAVRGDDGKVVGGIVLGTPLNDERLSNASDKTSGRILAAAIPSGDDLTIVARSSGGEALGDSLSSGPAKASIKQALKTGQVVDVGGLPEGYSGVTRALDGYGDGMSAAVVSVRAPVGEGLAASLIWPAVGVTLLGIILVIIGGFLLDNYISRPIGELEDGLLAIMNGKADLRFEIEHAELGGLVFRINSLLNQLYGVQEDDTDEQGRPSHAPTAQDFTEALAVDERIAESGGADPEEVKRLREEADDAYYGRIFQEFIAAKGQLGDPTDHISREAFIGRIMASERDVSQKHGKPVRYKVEVQGKEVMLLAVPLA